MKLLKKIVLVVLMSIGTSNVSPMHKYKTPDLHDHKQQQKQAIRAQKHFQKVANPSARFEHRHPHKQADLSCRQRTILTFFTIMLLANAVMPLIARATSESTGSTTEQLSLFQANPVISSARGLAHDSFGNQTFDLSSFNTTHTPDGSLQFAEDNATITHVRPNGFIQKCNIVNNEHVICTLENPHDATKKLIRDFRLQFDGNCEEPEEGPQTFDDTKILQELQNVVPGPKVSFLEITPQITPILYHTIQELLASTKVNLTSKLLSVFDDNAFFSYDFNTMAIGLPYALSKKNDQALIGTLAHEIGHATQSSIDKLRFERVEALPQYGSLLVLLWALVKAKAVFSSVMLKFPKLIPCVSKQTSIKLCTWLFLFGFFMFWHKNVTNIVRESLAFCFNYLKWYVSGYRQMNFEINADLLSTLISENDYKYRFFTSSTSLYSTDEHPSDFFRCAYIQEFIKKYQELLAWFKANQWRIE